ncbi:MAG TPA: cation diffusion facilitator family transporter [Burkholderiaceae bacterium]|nr:cation diffusion facilitator family transporter [Burkholderiaceae bacterium]
MSAQADSLKSIFFALGANFAIAIAKTVGAVYTGSSSMLAEAIHSFADCGNQALLIWGLKEAKRQASPEHPLGHGRAIYFWSFIVALMLFSMGGLFSIYEGAHKLHDSEPVKYAWVAVGILTFGVVAESVSLWGALREIDKERGATSLWRWFRTSRQSELLVIFGEDLAALGGLVLALGFIGASMITGNPMWDAIGSICIGVLLVLVAVLVGIEVKALLVGQSAEPAVVERLRVHLLAQAEVETIYSLITQQLGGEVMLAVKARMRPQPSDIALIDAINRVERGLRAAFPQLRWVFFEPDLSD